MIVVCVGIRVTSIGARQQNKLNAAFISLVPMPSYHICMYIVFIVTYLKTFKQFNDIIWSLFHFSLPLHFDGAAKKQTNKLCWMYAKREWANGRIEYMPNNNNDDNNGNNIWWLSPKV